MAYERPLGVVEMTPEAIRTCPDREMFMSGLVFGHRVKLHLSLDMRQDQSQAGAGAGTRINGEGQFGVSASARVSTVTGPLAQKVQVMGGKIRVDTSSLSKKTLSEV